MKKYLYLALLLCSNMSMAYYNGECNINFAIPDNNCTSPSTFSLDYFQNNGATLGTAFRLDEVRIFVEHSYVRDLQIKLISPSGTTIDLMNNRGGGGENFGVSCSNAMSFSMNGVSLSEMLGADEPFNIVQYKPEGDFADFNGETPDGSWIIEVCDNANHDDGVFQYAELFFKWDGLLNEYCGGVPIDIPDNNCDFPISIPLEVAGNIDGTVGVNASLKNVDLFIEHSFVGDLEMSLISPNGVEVMLLQKNGGEGNDFGESCNTVLSLNPLADVSISEAFFSEAPFVNRNYRPIGDFAAFDNAPINGIWQVKVCDDASDDTGMIHYAKLNFQVVSAVDDLQDISNEVKVYPNPSSEYCFIEWSTQSVEIANYYVSDMTGRMLKSGSMNSNTKVELEVQNFESGIYILQIQNEHGIATKNLVVN